MQSTDDRTDDAEHDADAHSPADAAHDDTITAPHSPAGHENDMMSGHVLDQSEIDSLLGNTFAGLPTKEETGMERVIKAGFVAYERLPMLEIVFDRLVRLLSSTLRSFTNDNVEITMESMRSMCFGDYMNAVPSSSLFAVFKAMQWENYGLLVVDSSLSYSIIDILMGGPRGTGHVGTETRPHTAIERALIEKLIVLTLNDLSAAFSPVCAIDLSFERLEVSSRFAAIARASNAVVMTKLHIDMEDRSGNLDLIIPYATLEPVRDQLSQQFMGERFGRDSIWESHLISEILETDVEVSAVFEEKTVALSEVLNLKPGMQITFPHQTGTPLHVRLQCGHTQLFEGRLGQLHGKAAVKVERRLVPADSPHNHTAPATAPAPSVPDAPAGKA
ncbi:MAG: flagellar motor switch protein FliM [Acetobacter sp.]|uniref:flagellar motor switch protein FliM n=1 Tax=Acetobacter sp. TaxID=440 RepID=UPI0039E7EC46